MRQTGTACARAGIARFVAKGTMAMACREVPGNAVYFCAFTAAVEAQRQQSRATDGATDTFLGNALAGCCAGTAWSLCVHPIDALRVQYVTGRPLKLTYCGIAPAVTRASLSATIFFATFGEVRRWYESLDHDPW